jgi:hypothetical protein
MPATTRLVGIILALLGVVTYLATGRTSVTALIPAFFGVIFLLMAWLARTESLRKHVMHVAMVVALVGLVATLVRAVPAIGDGQIARPAVLAQIAMSAILAWYLAAGIRSFRAARLARG